MVKLCSDCRNGRYVVFDAGTGELVDDNNGRLYEERELESAIGRKSTELRQWCYGHGVLTDEFNYYDKLLFDYYMLHKDEYIRQQKSSAQARADERERKEQARLAEIKRQRDAYAAKLKQEREEAERKAAREEAERIRQEEERHRAELAKAEAQRKEERRRRDLVSGFLDDNKRFYDFCLMLRGDYGECLIDRRQFRRIVYDHLRFYDCSRLDFSPYDVSTIICSIILGVSRCNLE